jgi:hypothetical protein
MVLNNKSQITIFVILALLIVVVIIIIFIGKDRISLVISKEVPIEQVSNCINKVIVNSTKIIFSKGGSLNPENAFLYRGEKIEYLCYTNENYKPCLIQRPLLKEHVENEILKYSQSRIQDCIDTIKVSLEKKGYLVSFRKYNLSIELVPDSIIINLKNIDLKISKDITESYKSFKTTINSKSYNIIMIVSSILNFEARYGDSESMSYMLYYPGVKVEKKLQSDGTRIYIINETTTNERFVFASRSFALPAEIISS